MWHEGLAIFMYDFAALKSKGGPYRQTNHNARLFTKFDLLKSRLLLLPLVKYPLFRTITWTSEYESTKVSHRLTAHLVA